MANKRIRKKRAKKARQRLAAAFLKISLAMPQRKWFTLDA